MSDDKKDLQKSLACYGSDVRRWPESMKAQGLWAMERPEFASIFQEEKHFEQAFLAMPMGEPVSTLQQRIISAALQQPQSQYGQDWLYEFPAARPVALAAMLLLGFAIGFGITNYASPMRDSHVVQTSSDDDGAIL